MKRTLIILAIAAVLGVIAGTDEAVASCQEANGSTFPIRQCITAAATPSWFAPPPSGSGPISSAWWVLGFGNRTLIDPTGGANAEPSLGCGFITGTGMTNHGTFTGNDSGNTNTDLVPAPAGGVGATCFSFAANWGNPGNDGCADLNRTYNNLGEATNASDGYLNPYWSGAPGTYSYYALVDAPMGALLTEGSDKHFAVAFFSSTTRHLSENDVFDRGWDMGAITNGDSNPSGGNNNVIPWQPIPDPTASAVVDPNDQSRVVNLTWPHIRRPHDGSSRLNPAAAIAVDGGRHVLGTAFATASSLLGVGVAEQSELVSYLVEIKPIVGLDCDANAPWNPAGPGSLVVPPNSEPAGSMQSTTVDVPPNTCLRLTTRFGRVPTQAMRTTGTASSNRVENRFDACAGKLGDLGYNVSSSTKKIGEAFLSEKPVLRAARMNQRNLVVEFETLGEFGVQSFDIVAKDRKGNTSVIARVECTQCSSGIGAQYSVDVPMASVRSATSVHVVMQPSGSISNEITISREQQPQPPTTPRRGGR